MNRSQIRNVMAHKPTARLQARNISKRKAGYTAELTDNRKYRLERQEADAQ